jgi:seryl-tRNA synthetase
MINVKDFKKNFDIIKKKINQKDPSFPVDELYNLHLRRNSLLQSISLYNEQINNLSNPSKTLNMTMESIKIEVKNIKEKLEIDKIEFELVDKKYENLLLSCPNIPSDDIPHGTKNENYHCRTFGNKPSFNFAAANHLDLLTKHQPHTINFGAIAAKSGFYCYQNKVAWLLYRLANICLKFNEKKGFSVTYIPQVANYQTIENAGNLPRFKEELFFLNHADLILIPTAEVILASYCANQVHGIEKLPIRLTSWTRCYRKEIGGYGANERGLIRVHEFEKIELFSFTSQDQSNTELEFMVQTVEELLQLFNIHYRVMLLATGDCSFSSTKTYDIEIWLPGQNDYKEVSSISNCTDFQARRSNSKYTENGKNYLMHTLNGSSLALPRLMVALIETWQTRDGIDFDGLFALIAEIEKNI